MVSALCHLVDIGTSLKMPMKMPARLSLEREPDTTLAHEVVYEHHSTDVLTFAPSCAAKVLSWIYEMSGRQNATSLCMRLWKPPDRAWRVAVRSVG